MGDCQLYCAEFDRRGNKDLRIRIIPQKTWPDEPGFQVSIDDDYRSYLSEDHLRELREEITKALGESPQDSSKIEVIKSMVADMRAALDVVAATLEPADEPAERTV